MHNRSGNLNELLTCFDLDRSEPKITAVHNGMSKNTAR